MMGEIQDSTWLADAKPAAAAVMLVLLWTVESIVPMFSGRTGRVRHGAVNLMLGVANAVMAALIFGASMLFVTEWARQQPFGLLHWLALPAWVEWALGLVLFDGWMYTWHRLSHRVKFLWRFHAVHHSDRAMDVTSAVRFHTGEIAISSLARLAVLPVIGLTMPQLLLYEAILLPVILFHHSNIRIPSGLDRALRCVITTPWMHWVHHSAWQPETDSNFSSVLSIWDRVFGTFRLRDDPGTIQLGLDDGQEKGEWQSLRAMIASPFRKQVRAGRPADKGPDLR
jgi:sterol desaturase/sphingolipid hydroxylase (fatty acid hydroxylase superfamily)